MEEYIPSFPADKQKAGKSYSCKFIDPGAVGYMDGVYLLEQEVLDELAPTLLHTPVIIGHQDIVNEEDMLNKAVGYVTDVHRCPDTGKWYCDFCIFNESDCLKIDDGVVPYVSCGYRATLTECNTLINNVQYKKRIIGGTMLHLALVKNPRYNGTEIWKNSSDDYFVTEGELCNAKENVMFGFKKEQVALDKDVLINTADGEKTIEQIVNELEAANAKIAEQEAKVAEQEAKIAEQDDAIKNLEAANAELKAQAEAKETQPQAEEKTEKAPEATDADLKKDLNNALTEEVIPDDKAVKVPVINF